MNEKKFNSFLWTFFKLPAINIYIYDNNYTFLIDTGSNDCSISSETYKKIKKETKINFDEKQISYTGIGINNAKSIEINLDFKINQTEYRFPFSIIDLFEYNKGFNPVDKNNEIIHGILGCYFFEKYKSKINFNENKICLYENINEKNI